MEFIIAIVVLIFSVIIHEVSHGVMAYRLGDPTAKYAGRLTLNPVNHIDPVGSILFPLLMLFTSSSIGRPILFGWAKPVPYNPYNLRDQKWGPALVGLAGPLSNLILAILAGISLRLLLVRGIGEENIMSVILLMMVTINIALMVFNLLPIPPLDGSKLLFAVLPLSEHTKQSMDQYGFIFLLALIVLFGSLLGMVIQAVINLFLNAIVFA